MTHSNLVGNRQKKRMRSWPWNLPASTFPDVEEHMNRIAKNVQPLVLAAVLFVAGAYFGARFVGKQGLAKQQGQPMVIPVDGNGGKPPGACC